MQIKHTPEMIRLNESQTMQPITLAKFLDINPNEILTFSLQEDQQLPFGLILDKSQGIISGSPELGAARADSYIVNIEISNGQEILILPVEFWIYKALSSEEIEQLRHQTWETLSDTGELPQSLQTIIDRPISKTDVFYLLERYASFTIWNADDLRLADQGKQISLKDSSPHFLVFDFEVCLVATPKDLFTFDRTLVDASKTARAMIKEAYNRRWNVEFGGYDRMANAAWYEARNLSLTGEHQMQVRNYEPPAIKQLQEQNKPSSHT